MSSENLQNIYRLGAPQRPDATDMARAAATLFDVYQRIGVPEKDIDDNLGRLFAAGRTQAQDRMAVTVAEYTLRGTGDYLDRVRALSTPKSGILSRLRGLGSKGR